MSAPQTPVEAHRNEPQVIARTLRKETWAVVGLASHPGRTAYSIAAWLQGHGRRIVPVHPLAETVLGEPGYPSLADIPFPVDVVDVFRRSDAAGQFVDQAAAIGASAVWLQLGVVDHEAAARGVAAGLDVVMDTCPVIEWPAHGQSRAG